MTVRDAQFPGFVLERFGRLALPGLALLAVAVGCSKEATPSPEQPRAQSAGAAEGKGAGAGEDKGEESSGEAVALGEAKASYSEANFVLAIKADGSFEKGKQGTAEIVLEAKAPFHANDKYPYKFKLGASPGVAYPDKIVGKDKAKIEQMKVTMPVVFTAEEPGKKKIAGVFHFSVCTDDKCLIEKRQLAVDVDVK